jgi:alkylhydroperoxidase family enzyme
VLVSLERYAHLFERDGSPLADGDRAAIASAVAAVVAGGPAPDGHDLGDGTRRTTALARFATRLVARCFMVDAGDLARLSRAGLTPDEVAAAAESALAFHVVARLVRACRAAPGARSCGRMKLGDDVRAA